jgi:hypothetical protein
MKYDKFTFFWSGPFSQWYKSNFYLNGRAYNCAEQFMMAEKARLFGDSKTESLILLSEDPREQKQLGRQVVNFNAVIWEQNCKSIVRMGNILKFEQNEDLRAQLLMTAKTLLVEASPYDKIWGIGLAENHPDAQDPTKWRGQNLLGEILTDIRDNYFIPKFLEDQSV